MYTRNSIRKTKSNIISNFFNSIVDQLKKRNSDAIKSEFISDLKEQRQQLTSTIIELEKAKALKNTNKIQNLEIKACSINKKILKDCEIFEALFSYHPRWDENID